MAYTRADILSSVRALLNETTAGFWTDAEIDTWTNDGQRDIATKALCIESKSTIATVNGTLEYAYTGIAVRSAGYLNKSLTKITPIQIGHPPANGTIPQFWYEWGGKIGILPVPDAVYTIDLYTAIDSVDMATGAATSNLPQLFRLPMILYGVYRALIKDRKFAQAAQVYSIYINELQFSRLDVIERKPDTRDSKKIPDRLVSQTG